MPTRKLFIVIIFIFSFLAFFGAGKAEAGNIDPNFRWASSSIGWIDFFNVTVATSVLTGSASSSTGVILMNCSDQGECATRDYRVINDGYGILRYRAWSTTTNYVYFNSSEGGACANDAGSWCVWIDYFGYFHGKAWSDNIGWIIFNCEDISSCSGVDGNWKVKTSWAAPYAVTGQAISIIYDTRVSGGAAFNTLYWKGIKPAGTTVKFQFASSNCSNGATNVPACTTDAGWVNKFKGPDGSGVTYYEPSPYTWTRIDGASSTGGGGCLTGGSPCHNNRRYFRYKAILQSVRLNVTPTVKSLVVSYSP